MIYIYIYMYNNDGYCDKRSHSDNQVITYWSMNILTRTTVIKYWKLNVTYRKEIY